MEWGEGEFGLLETANVARQLEIKVVDVAVPPFGNLSGKRGLADLARPQHADNRVPSEQSKKVLKVMFSADHSISLLENPKTNSYISSMNLLCNR